MSHNNIACSNTPVYICRCIHGLTDMLPPWQSLFGRFSFFALSCHAQTTVKYVEPHFLVCRTNTTQCSCHGTATNIFNAISNKRHHVLRPSSTRRDALSKSRTRTRYSLKITKFPSPENVHHNHYSNATRLLAIYGTQNQVALISLACVNVHDSAPSASQNVYHLLDHVETPRCLSH